jgi:hypothetical protein
VLLKQKETPRRTLKWKKENSTDKERRLKRGTKTMVALIPCEKDNRKITVEKKFVFLMCVQLYNRVAYLWLNEALKERKYNNYKSHKISIFTIMNTASNISVIY